MLNYVVPDNEDSVGYRKKGGGVRQFAQSLNDFQSDVSDAELRSKSTASGLMLSGTTEGRIVVNGNDFYRLRRCFMSMLSTFNFLTLF